jgi:hypothetical protein
MVVLLGHVAESSSRTATRFQLRKGQGTMADKFQRHRQPWTQDEVQKLHLLAGKGMSLKAISKAMTRSEESIQVRAKADGLKVSKLR